MSECKSIIILYKAYSYLDQPVGLSKINGKLITD